MNIDRRTSLKGLVGVLGLVAGATTTYANSGQSGSSRVESGGTGPALKVLVLGGTRYLGPAVVRSALAHGHEVTLFNRGITQPWLFPGIEKLKGNRYPEVGAGLRALKGRNWDVIIDLCGQFPRVVEASAKLLSDVAQHYIFVSSISAYASFSKPGIDEEMPLRPLSKGYTETPELIENDWATYGARKALSEAAVARHFSGRSTIIRPGPICGGENNDGSGAYWAERLYRDKYVLAPGDGTDPVQLIDVGDAGAFIVSAAERKLQGPYNLVGPGTALSARDYLETCRHASGGSGEIIFAGTFRDKLAELPMIPPYKLVPGHATIRNDKALEHGLQLRPLKDTIRENWVDHRSRRGVAHDFKIGPSPAEEAAMISTLNS